MKHILIAITLIASLLATGESQRKKKDYQYNLKKFDSFRAYINFGIGKLNLGPGQKRYILTGSIDYDKSLMAPNVSLTSQNNIAKLIVDIKADMRFGNDNGNFSMDDLNINKDDNNYKINFKMPTRIATDMHLDFGLGEAELDLTNLRISQFKMDCGLSDVRMKVSKPNRIDCDIVEISTGISDYDGKGLGNLNSSKYIIDVGLGSANIDFTGDLDQDTNLNISVGLGSLELLLPDHVNIKLTVDSGLLSSIDVRGLVSKGNGHYESKDWHERWSTIEGKISVGLGSVDVDVDVEKN